MNNTPSIRDQILLKKIKDRLSELEKLLEEVNSHWGCEDSVYRFYHQSFKVYHLQDTTERITKLLFTLSPNEELTKFFKEIIATGTNKSFELSHNKDWTMHTRPIVEAFFMQSIF